MLRVFARIQKFLINQLYEFVGRSVLRAYPTEYTRNFTAISKKQLKP